MNLLDLMIDHLRRLSLSSSSSNEEEKGKGRGMKTMMRLSDLSYNLIMTEGYLHLVPRSRESYYYDDNVVVVEEEEGEEEEGRKGRKGISINALGYGGKMLIKSKEELAIIQQVGIINILTQLGYSSIVEHRLTCDEIEQSLS